MPIPRLGCCCCLHGNVVAFSSKPVSIPCMAHSTPKDCVAPRKLQTASLSKPSAPFVSPPQGTITAGEGEAPVKRQRTLLEAGSGGPGAAASLLASLPQEVLLHVLHLAARPISAWVTGVSLQ
jgi:hypothetical protein